MALVIEDGSLVAGANSYAAIETIDAYHAAHGNAAWTGEDTAKEAAILRAMLYIESLPWHGVKSTRDQALEWPRAYIVDHNGYGIDSNVIPPQVVQALAEAALRELVSAGTTLADAARDDVLTSLDVAGAVKLAWASSAPTKTDYPIIKAILRGLIAPAGGMRMVR